MKPLLRVGIWLEYHPKNERTSESNSWALKATGYHLLDGSGIRRYGLNPNKKGCIQINVADKLLGHEGEWLNENYPCWLLHEFAHAYQDLVLGNNNEIVVNAYRHALFLRLYDRIETRQFAEGKRTVISAGPAYARTNAQEYFAELSVAFLAQNSLFYPHTKSELRTHDVMGYRMAELAWTSMRFAIRSQFENDIEVFAVGASGKRIFLFDLSPNEQREFEGWKGIKLLVVDQGSRHESTFTSSDRVEGIWKLEPKSVRK